MNVLVIGINYAPEMVGIGPYTTGMAQFLAAMGHSVTVICAKPYYPLWKVDPAYSGGGIQTSTEQGVRIVRVPTYVPANPNGTRRVLHHISFAARAQLAAINETRRSRPDIVIGIAPSLISIVAARKAASRTGAKLWLHIQDFEVEAAFATGLLKDIGLLAQAAYRFEKWAIQADRVSTISPQMCTKLIEKGVAAERIVEFRNWANLDHVRPLDRPSPYREVWGINCPYVALYSGNIANKQGIEIVVDAARLLRHRKDLAFVVCGSGPNREQLLERAAGLENIHFYHLQPPERLSDLLGMASVHLLPQIAGAADLVLPSKLTNMLASGRPIVTTALPQTGLAEEVTGCGLVTPPGDTAAFASAIELLLDDPTLHDHVSRCARQRAVERWSQKGILLKFEEALLQTVQENAVLPLMRAS